MPAGGLVTAAVIAAAVGGGTAAFGASQKKKYQKQMDALKMPTYETPQEEYDIQNLAASRANQGMGAGARQQLQNNADRNLSTLSNAALMGGADANSIGGLVDKSQNAYNQNAMYDDQIRLQNLQNLQSSYARMSANKDKSWQSNQYQPWKNKMTGLSGQLQGASNMMQSGINMFGSSLISAGGAIGGMSGAGAAAGGAGNMQSDMGMLPMSGPSQMPYSAPMPSVPATYQQVPGMTYPNQQDPNYPTNHQAMYEPGIFNNWGQYGME